MQPLLYYLGRYWMPEQLKERLLSLQSIFMLKLYIILHYSRYYLAFNSIVSIRLAHAQTECLSMTKSPDNIKPMVHNIYKY